MARIKKTNKVKNKAAAKKTTAKKKTVKKTEKKKTTKKNAVSPYLTFRKPVYLIPSIDKDLNKKLGYFELNRAEGKIIETALKYYSESLDQVVENPKNEILVDRTKSLIRIFSGALKKS